MSSLVGGPSMVGGLGPGAPCPSPKSGPELEYLFLIQKGMLKLILMLVVDNVYNRI